MTTDQISLTKTRADDAEDFEAEDYDAEDYDAEDEFVDDADEPAAPKAKRSWKAPKRLRGFGIGPRTAKVVSALAVAAIALAAALYFVQFRPEQQTGDAARQEVLRAATEGTVAILTYSPDNLDQAFTTAKSHLTGDFLSYYADFTQQIVAPAAREKAVNTSASVVSAAVTELKPDSAVVLLFVNQQTMSNERAEPSLAASTVLVTLTKLNGAWLISEFTPI